MRISDWSSDVCSSDLKIDTIRSHAEAVPLLLPHTAYKSYPESWLMDERWDRLGKWMDTVSSHRVPAQDRSKVRDMDDWIEQLQAQGFFASCSSGTTGKSAMLVASRRSEEHTSELQSLMRISYAV